MHRSNFVQALIAAVAALFWFNAGEPGFSAEQSPDDQSVGIEFFERRIRPVLIDHCYECHSGDSDVLQGGLRLDIADDFLHGGDSGAAIKPGSPSDSLLIAALRYDGMEMPPDQPLEEAVIRDFEKWIRLGAAMPQEKALNRPDSSNPVGSGKHSQRSTTIDWETERQYWAYQTPQQHDPNEINADNPTATVDDQWRKSKLDGFVQLRLALQGLKPNPPASRVAWLRRVTFDLIGLMPTPAEIQSFRADSSPLAEQRVVDRLLSSPQHAERWARRWLDVARYAEDQAHIVGNNDSLTYPNAYLYRDWVINALASDIPYDEFIRLQLAADLIKPDAADQHAALGFIGLGPKYYRRNSPEVMADEWEDRIDTVTRGLLGLTVACARCHDHKYDPIPTRDYYALAGVFASTEMFNRPLSDAVEKRGDESKRPQDAIHIVREGTPKDLAIMIRGDAKRLGETVPRGFLTILSSNSTQEFGTGSGRQTLADVITERSNPLTARVIVNRVWRELIGSAIVSTPSNFGSLGASPTHPLMLDDLAARFMDAQWSLKWLQREIVLSATYRQSSDVDPSKSAIDAENRLLWRIPRKRLSLEAYRDAILMASGNLDHRVGGKSIDPQLPEVRRRTVYSQVSRLGLNPMMARFDFPDPNAHSPGRHETTTPLQKLFLLNSPFLVHHAQEFADRIRASDSINEHRIVNAYQLLYGRIPSAEELQLAVEFVADDSDASWAGLAQTLLISNEMFILD